ncbi:hypothetical protein FKP32DRAFT_1674568 [Trametes sanguinea]|nr:hypothetical protein FKP32DRAFT_1674568 [Trametes sanguinea]
MQAHVAPALAYTDNVVPLPEDGSQPSLPDDLDTKTPEEQEYLRMHWRLAGRYYWYNILTQGGQPLRGEAFRLPHYVHLANLVPYITRCLWHEIVAGDSTPCPIDFTPDEVAAHARELGCMNDGSVAQDEYEAAKVQLERFREEWDETAMKGPFPFFEGTYSYYLT